MQEINPRVKNDIDSRASMPDSGRSVTAFDASWVKEALKIKAPGFEFYSAPTISSTMDVARYMSDRRVDLAHGMILFAERQSAGVGRTGPWQSDDGDIKMTVVLNEAASLEEHILIRAASALAVVDGLKTATGQADLPVGFKWPNDVRTTAPENKKLCGLLVVGKFDEEAQEKMTHAGIATDPAFLLMGIGINLGKEVTADPSISGLSTSLEHICGVRHPRETIIVETIKALASAIDELSTNRPRFLQRLSDALLTGPGETLVVETKGGDKKTLRFMGFSNNQMLLADMASGESKDIALSELIRAYPPETEYP